MGLAAGYMGVITQISGLISSSGAIEMSTYVSVTSIYITIGILGIIVTTFVGFGL